MSFFKLALELNTFPIFFFLRNTLLSCESNFKFNKNIPKGEYIYLARENKIQQTIFMHRIMQQNLQNDLIKLNETSDPMNKCTKCTINHVYHCCHYIYIYTYPRVLVPPNACIMTQSILNTFFVWISVIIWRAVERLDNLDLRIHAHRSDEHRWAHVNLSSALIYVSTGTYHLGLWITPHLYMRSKKKVYVANNHWFSYIFL